MKKEKKLIIWVISIIVLLALIILVLIISLKQNIQDKNPKYACSLDSDCVSQCFRGCVNYNWALQNPDTTECFRAWACSCVDNQCYTDGKPRN
jgi:hypothetical protein